MPTILLPGIGTGQSPPRALHRIAQAMQQLAHMSGMVLHIELLFDHPGDHRRGPHSAIQSIADTSSDAIAAREESWLLLHKEYATFTSMMSFYLCASV